MKQLDSMISAIADLVGWVDKGNLTTSYPIASAEESDRQLHRSVYKLLTQGLEVPESTH